MLLSDAASVVHVMGWSDSYAGLRNIQIGVKFVSRGFSDECCVAMGLLSLERLRVSCSWPSCRLGCQDLIQRVFKVGIFS